MLKVKICSFNEMLKCIFILFILFAFNSCGGGSSSASLPSTDKGRPFVTKTIPTDAEVDVSNNVLIQIVFSEDMNKASVESGIAFDNGVTGSVNYDISNKTASFTTTSLISDKLYTGLLRSTIKDTAGNALIGNQSNGDYSWSFKTLDNIPPTILSRVPDDDPQGQVSVGVNSKIVVNFSEEIHPSTLTAGFNVTSGVSNTLVSGQFSILDFTVTFTPNIILQTNSLLKYNTIYNVTINKSITDLNANALETQNTYSFKTELDMRPKYTLKYPSVDNAINVSKNKALEIEFNTRMDTSLLNDNTFKVKDSKGNPVPGQLSYDLATNTVSFNPDTNLNLLQTYSITLSSLFKDALGKELVLKNNGVSTFSVEDGIWVNNSTAVVSPNGTSSISSTHKLVSDGLGNAAIVWVEFDSASVSRSLVSKFFTDKIGWEAVDRITGAANAILNEDFDIAMDRDGRLLITHNDNVTGHVIASYRSKSAVFYDTTQIDNIDDTSKIEKLIMSSNGQAILIFSVRSATSISGFYSRILSPSQNTSVAATWNPVQLIEKIGQFNGVNAVDNILQIKATINNSGVASVIYSQNDSITSPIKTNLWVNTSPFQASTPTSIEQHDLSIFDINSYTVSLNNNGIISYSYSDGTTWNNQYLETAGWQQESQVSTVPASVTIFKTLLFNNNKKLIIYEENGELKSTEFNDVLGWQTPKVVSLTKKYPRSNGSKIFIPTSIYISFNKDNNIVIASWETQSGFMVRRYTPNLGWQTEKQVIAIANPAERGYLRTVTNNDGTALAVWTQINSVNNKTEIFSAIFN